MYCLFNIQYSAFPSPIAPKKPLCLVYSKEQAPLFSKEGRNWKGKKEKHLYTTKPIHGIHCSNWFEKYKFIWTGGESTFVG
jgi:hypothetical protein